MNRITFLVFLLITISFSTFGIEREFVLQGSDTIVTPSDQEEELAIEEILKTRTAPKKEKVQYFQQVTKYGFKNLFNNYSYNPAMAYRNQVNPYAETYMQDYLQSHSNSLLKMKSWAPPYFSLIDNILGQYGLPKELKYLAVIESNLHSTAMSWVGARGPWQFMSYTGREYGLTINSYIDERTDYYKSTHAAARYLLSLYKDLKDWLLVIAAYNGGPGRVYTAIRKSGSRNFWALQYNLPTESRNHVKKFIATHYIMEAGAAGNTDHGNLGSVHSTPFVRGKISAEDELSTEVLALTGKYNSAVISKNLMLDISEFNRTNPGFDMVMASGEPYDMRLSSDKMDLFVANKFLILNECIQMLLTSTNTDTKTIYSKEKQTRKAKK